MSGLDKITSVFYLLIDDNSSLTSLKGLEKLQNVTGKVVAIGVFVFVSGSTRPSGNDKLLDFCALTSLFTNGIYGTVYIENNLFNPTIQNIKDGNCSQ